MTDFFLVFWGLFYSFLDQAPKKLGHMSRTACAAATIPNCDYLPTES